MPASQKSLTEICEAAEKLGSREEKLAFVATACGEDVEFRRRVEELLFGPEPPEEFMRVATSVTDLEQAGLKIGRYKLLRLLGEGGMGSVWLAEQEEPVRRRVALKVIKLGMDTKSVIARFEAERQALAVMDHPNIAKVYDAGATETGRPYFVMELVEGDRLTDYCDQRSLSTADRLALFAQVCHAVQHAHQKGVIHRDIKPSNILVAAHDGVAIPKVIDFGIAKATDQQMTEKTLLTDLGQFMGTPAYMSPEQAEGGRDLDTRSDIYGLGVLLYELLTGRTPFDTKELLQSGLDEMRRIIREIDPMRPSARIQALPVAEQTTTAERRQAVAPKLMGLLRGDLDWIVMQCLEKDRTRRYQSAGGLADEIRRHLGHQPILARPPSQVYRLGKLIRRKPALAGTMAALGLAMAAAAVFWFQSERAGLEARRATEQSQRRDLRLRNAQLLKERPIAWSAQIWSNCVTATLTLDDEIRSDAIKSLVGLDVRQDHLFTNRAASSVAFARDGRLLVGGGGLKQPAYIVAKDGTIEELDVHAPGPVCWTLDGTPYQLSAGTNVVAFRNMRSRSISRAFPLAAGEHVRGAGRGPPTMTLTPDGRRAAAVLVGPQQVRIVVWDTTTNLPVGEILLKATALAFTPDGSLLGAGDEEGDVHVFSLPDLRQFARLRAVSRRGPVLGLAFAKDRVMPYENNGTTNRWVAAVGDKGGGLVVWQVNSQLPRTYCRGSPDTVLSVAFHPDGVTVASAGRGLAHIWDAMTGDRLQTLSGQGGDAAWALSFDDTGNRLTWGNSPGFGMAYLGIWSLDLNRGIHALRGLANHTRWVWFSSDSRHVAALGNDWHLGVWDVPSGRLRWLFEAPVGRLTDNAGAIFDIKGDRLAFATGKEARLYDLDTGQTLQQWPLNMGLCDTLQFDSHGRLLLLRREAEPTGRSERFWRLYELGKGLQPVLLHSQNDTNLASFNTWLMPGAERFVVASGGGGTTPMKRVLKIFDAATGRELRTISTDRTTSDIGVALEPTGRWFAYTPDTTVQMRLLRLSDLVDYGNAPYANAISPEGDRFAVVDGPVVKVINRTNGGIEMALGTEWPPYFQPAFSPDGNLLGWGTAEGLVIVADLAKARNRMEQLQRSKLARDSHRR